METWQALIALIGSTILIIGSVITATIWILTRFNETDNKIENYVKAFIPIKSHIQGLGKVQELILTALAKAGLIKPENGIETYKYMAKASEESINEIFERQELQGILLLRRKFRG